MGEPGRLPTPAVLALAAVVVLILSFRPLLDPDIWFYLVQGRRIVETGEIPATEFYIFPAEGEEARYSAIGFGVFYFLVHQFAGYFGMAAVNALQASLSIVLLLTAAVVSQPERVRWPALVAAGSMVFLLAEFRFVYRPENVLFLFLGIELILLEAWLRLRRGRYLLMVMPLILLLSFIHTSVVLMLFVLFAYVSQFALSLFADRRPDAGRQLLIISGAIALTGLIPLFNPNGLEQFLIVLRSVTSISSDLVEYIPALQTEYRWHFVVAATLAAFALALSPKQRLVDWLLIGVFGYVAFIYARNIGLFALMLLVPLVRSLSPYCDHTSYRRLMFGAAALLPAICLFTTLTGGQWGYGVKRENEFVDAVQTIKAIGRERENVFNFFHHGGYVAWTLGPQHRVAIDGHFVRSSYASEYHDAVMRADPDWETLLRTYDVRFILTPATLPFSGTLIPLVRVLAGHDGWILSGVEPAGLLFVRSDLRGAAPERNKAAIWTQALTEASAVLEVYPTHQGAKDSVAESTRRIGGGR